MESHHIIYHITVNTIILIYKAHFVEILALYFHHQSERRNMWPLLTCAFLV